MSHVLIWSTQYYFGDWGEGWIKKEKKEVTEGEKTKEKQEAKGGGQGGLNRLLQFWLLTKSSTFIFQSLKFDIFYFSVHLYKIY